MYSHLLHWQVAANYSLNHFTNDRCNYETCTEHSFLKLAIFYAWWFDTSFRTNWPYLNYTFFAASNHSVTGLKTIYEQNFQKVSVDTWFSIFLFLLLCYSCATYTPKKKKHNPETYLSLYSPIFQICALTFSSINLSFTWTILKKYFLLVGLGFVKSKTLYETKTG